ncbi:unnamed protein product [Lepidochelys kempii]
MASCSQAVGTPLCCPSRRQGLVALALTSPLPFWGDSATHGDPPRSPHIWVPLESGGKAAAYKQCNDLCPSLAVGGKSRAGQGGQTGQGRALLPSLVLQCLGSGGGGACSDLLLFSQLDFSLLETSGSCSPQRTQGTRKGSPNGAMQLSSDSGWGCVGRDRFSPVMAHS